MFENLSSREKKLLIVIGALVPIAIVFLCIYQMTSSFKANNEQIQSLDLQILDEQQREIEGMLAGRRQTYYSNTSLHTSLHTAGNHYQNWLQSAMADSGLTWTTVETTPGSRLRSGNQTIGTSKLFKVPAASGTLTQFNDFLSKFYQLDVLHRINYMDLMPQTESRGANKVRNGKLTIKMTVEALSLKSGKHHDGFETDTDADGVPDYLESDFRTNLVNKEKDYKAILRRNIFGPANSEPILNASNKTCTTGKPFSTTFTAKDANPNDLLKFEWFEKSIEEATISQDKPTDRKIRFEMPDVEPGKYSFKVKVIDNGFPEKSSIEEFVVTVKEPRKPKKAVERSKPDPEVDYIRLVKVTGIKRDRDGELRVWLSLGPPNGNHERLKVGETFEVGKKEYKVVAIEADQATFAGDKKTFRARIGWSSADSDISIRGGLIETNM